MLKNSHLLIFLKSIVSKMSQSISIRVPNSLDPGQARHSVGPDKWVQTVCKGYMQMTLVGKDLTTIPLH